MSAELDYFLNSNVGKMLVETLEFTFPGYTSNMVNSFGIVANINGRIHAVAEDGRSIICDYVPCRVERSSLSNEQLDQDFKITMQDVGIALHKQLSSCYFGTVNQFNHHPYVCYRAYGLDHPYEGPLTELIVGPIKLPIQNVAFNVEGCTITASSKPLNNHITGDFYDFERYPMLKGCL